MQTSGVFIYDAHFPVPLLGQLPAAEALAMAAPYGRPALVPGALWSGDVCFLAFDSASQHGREGNSKQPAAAGTM